MDLLWTGYLAAPYARATEHPLRVQHQKIIAISHRVTKVPILGAHISIHQIVIGKIKTMPFLVIPPQALYGRNNSGITLLYLKQTTD